MPSRKLDSDKVVYYVHSVATKALLAKFDTDTQTAKEVEGYDDLSAEAQLELHNYIQNVRFFTELGLPAKLNRDSRFLLPEPLQQQLPKIFERANANGIPFNPVKAALNGMMNHIKTTVKHINEHEDCTLLTDIGLDSTASHSDAKAEKAKEVRKVTKKIFTALLDVKAYSTQYHQVANAYFDKDTAVNKTTLTYYAKGKTKPSQWSVSIALILLLGDNHPVLEKLPCPLLIELLFTPLRYANKITTLKAATTFINRFTLNPDFKKAIKPHLSRFFQT